jgi:peroxiredoxin
MVGKIAALGLAAFFAVPGRYMVGRPAPDFTVQTLEGKTVSLDRYRGRAVLISFWATWCGNCKLEMPWLAQLRQKYAGLGFEVLGILTDNASPQKVESLERQYGVQYPILLCNHATAQAYGGLPDLPESFFVDRKGKIIAVMHGADSKQEIEANIQKALGTPREGSR